MCNLYKMRQSAAEVAHLFVAETAGGQNVADDVYPGYPGLVVAEGQVRSMTWGFPLALTGKKGQRLKPRPVNNARSDKLAGPFWRDSFVHRRCLIPVTAWAEAEGQAGRMTRTWYGLPDRPLFAVAGIWRPTDEWGEAYSMVMVDGCAGMSAVHDRMPVVLSPEDGRTWLAGSPEAAFALCRTCDHPLTVEQSAEPWAAAREAPTREDRNGPAPRLL